MDEIRTIAALASEFWKLLRRWNALRSHCPIQPSPNQSPGPLCGGCLNSILAERSMSVVTFDGRQFEVNLPVSAVNADEFADQDGLVVERTLEPTVVVDMVPIRKRARSILPGAKRMHLGIDLGTSNSVIFGNEKGSLRLFKTVEGTDVLPSAILVDRRGNMHVGKKAYEQTAFSPENVAEGFNRLLGTSSTVAFSGTNRVMSPEEASSEVVKALLAQARMAAGEFPIEGAVVTIPAAFNQMQSEATMRAATAAGLDKLGLLQEPVAAAMAAIAERSNKNGQFLVYDLGGGTFDVAIVQSVGGAVNVVAHAGINMLGGRDFDRIIVNSIVRPWLADHFDLPENFQTDAAYNRLLRVAQMDDNGLLNCVLMLPAIGRQYDIGKFYVDAAGRRNFDGEEGTKTSGRCAG